MLSIDAGRPAPMTYNYQQQHPQLSRGMVGNGFSSRGKGDSIRKISIPSLPTISTSSYDDDGVNAAASPLPLQRGSGRSQLLAGLRTAPRTPTAEASDVGFGPAINEYPSGAWTRPAGQNGYPFKSQRALGYTNQPRSSAPEPSQESHNRGPMGKYAGLPTPPASSYIGQSEADYETQVYADLLARNISLAQQQQILQQQMRIVQQAQQLQQVHSQIQQLQIQSPIAQNLGTPPISPAVYSPVPSNLQSNFPLYNGQATYHPQHLGSHISLPVAVSPERSSPPGHPSRVNISSSPPRAKPASPPFRPSPSPSPSQDVKGEPVAPEKTPSPPATAPSSFRRGHKKCSSLSSCINASATANITDYGPKTSVPKFSNTPMTPINSTFGGRGDHPIRQPRGPPALEEILARPNAKYEGSKNFSSRQRRRALSKLVNAGIERRGAKPFTPTVGAMMSVSENDIMLRFDDSTMSTYFDGERNSPGVTDDESNVSSARLVRGSLAIPHSEASSEKRRSALF